MRTKKTIRHSKISSSIKTKIQLSRSLPSPAKSHPHLSARSCHQESSVTCNVIGLRRCPYPRSSTRESSEGRLLRSEPRSIRRKINSQRRHHKTPPKSVPSCKLQHPSHPQIPTSRRAPPRLNCTTSRAPCPCHRPSAPRPATQEPQRRPSS